MIIRPYDKGNYLFMRKLFYLLLVFLPLAAQNSDSLLFLAGRVFPGYAVEIRDYHYANLEQLITQLQKVQPAERTLQKRIEQARLKIQELQQAYVPQFRMGINQQITDIRERLVSIYTKVPVEWDNANPEQIDVNLPNGGHGILWMPKPTKYDWRNIDIHASRPYESNSAGFSTGLHYDYHSGISLDILNLNLNKRFSPETYGYDWYSSLDNTITIPLLKIFNSDLSPRESEIRAIEKGIENLQVSRELNRSREKSRLLSLLLKLYLVWEKESFYRQMVELTREQTGEIAALNSKNHLTVLEKIAVENELQSYLSSSNITSYEILAYSQAIRNERDSLVIYHPREIDLKAEISQLEESTLHLLDLANLEQTLTKSPELRMQENNLQTIKANLVQNSRYGKIQLDLVGSISMFTSSDLGFKSPAEAAKMAFTNPDGLNSSVGMQFSMPLSFRESDYRYRSALREFQIAAEEYLSSRAEFKRNYHDLRINLLNLRENLRVAQNNLEYAEKRLKISAEFFSLKRISAFEYNSYHKEELKSQYALKEAMINYCNALAEFRGMLKTIDSEER